MKAKKFTLNIEIKENNTPQNWKFQNIASLEQLALWMIVKNLAEKNIKILLSPNTT